MKASDEYPGLSRKLDEMNWVNTVGLCKPFLLGKLTVELQESRRPGDASEHLVTLFILQTQGMSRERGQRSLRPQMLFC